MRELKVEIYDKSFGIMIKPDAIYFHQNQYGISSDSLQKQLGRIPDEDECCSEGILDIDGDWYNIPYSPECLRQSTGQHDKNGVELFDGDRIKLEYKDGEVRICEILWGDSQFIKHELDGWDCMVEYSSLGASDHYASIEKIGDNLHHAGNHRRCNMILFKKEFIDAILNGTKTETRRKGKKRWNVGAIHQLQLSYYDKEPFAKVEILSVEEKYLDEMTDADAHAEGFKSLNSFYGWWVNQYGTFYPDESVWVVKFKVVENLRDVTP